MHADIQLDPTDKQKRIFNTLFAGPKKLLALLREEKPNLETDFDISYYLLSKKHELYSTLHGDDWESIADYLKVFLIKFRNNKDSNVLSLDAIDNCSISKDNLIFIPIKGVYLIQPKHPEYLLEDRGNWRSRKQRYNNTFDIFSVQETYWTRIQLTTQQFVRRKTVPIHVQVQENKPKPKVRNAVQNLDLILSLLLKSEVASSKAFSRVDYKSVQGRSVQGGGIELGRR